VGPVKSSNASSGSVALDGTAGNPYQGDSSTVEFDFNAA